MALLLFGIIVLLLVSCRLVAATIRDEVKWYLDPAVLFLSPWILGAFLLGLPGFEYQEKLSLSNVAYICLCLGGFAVGSSVAMLAKVGAPLSSLSPFLHVRTRATSYVPTFRFIAIVGLLGIFGYILRIQANIESIGIPLYRRFTPDGWAEARVLRRLVSMSQGEGVGLSGFVSGLSFFFLAYVTHLKVNLSSHKHWGWLRFLRIFTIAMILFDGLVINGGRLQVILLALLLLFTFALAKKSGASERLVVKKRSRFLKFVVGPALVLGMVFLFAVAFVQQRAGESNPKNLLLWVHRVKLEGPLLWLADRNDAFGYGILSLTYFSTPINTLALYLDLSESQFPGPYFGQYNIRPFAGMVVRRFDDRLGRNWSSEFERPLEDRGFGTGVWGTLVRDIAFDVGRSAVPLILTLFGFVSRVAVRSAFSSEDSVKVVFAAALQVCCIFAAFHSLFFIDPIRAIIVVGVFGLLLRAAGISGVRRPVLAANDKSRHSSVVRQQLRVK